MRKFKVLLISAFLVGALLTQAWAGDVIFNYPSQKKHVFKVCQLLIESTNWENPDPDIVLSMRLASFKPGNWDFDNPLAPTVINNTIWNWWLDPSHAGGGAGTPPSGPNYWTQVGHNLGDPITKDMPQYWEVPLNASTVTQLGNFDLILLTSHHNVVLSDRDLRYLKQIVDAGATLWVDNCHGMRIGRNSSSGFVEDSSRFITRLQFFDDGGASMPGNYLKYAVDPDDPLLNTPFKLSTFEIGYLGDVQWGSDWVTEYDPDEMHQIVQVGGQATAVTGNYGSGHIIMTACDVFCDVSNWLEQGLSEPLSTMIGDIKMLYNACALAGSWNQEAGVPRHYASTVGDFVLPLSLKWYAPLAGPSKSTPTPYKGLVYVVRDAPGFTAGGNATLTAFDADPSEDLDNDGNPDDGIADYSMGTTFDGLWTVDLPGLALTSSPAVGTTEDLNGNSIDIVVVTTDDYDPNTPSNSTAYIRAYLARPTPLNTPVLMWEQTINNATQVASPVLHRNVVYVAYGDDNDCTRIRAFRLLDGAITWEYPDPDATDYSGNPKLPQPKDLLSEAHLSMPGGILPVDWRKPSTPSVAAVHREVNDTTNDTLTFVDSAGVTWQLDLGKRIDLNTYPNFVHPANWVRAYAYAVNEYRYGGGDNTTTSVQIELTPGTWTNLTAGQDYIVDPAYTRRLWIASRYQGHRIRMTYQTGGGTNVTNEIQWVPSAEKWSNAGKAIVRLPNNTPIDLTYDADRNGASDADVQPLIVTVPGANAVVITPTRVDVNLPGHNNGIYEIVYRNPSTPDSGEIREKHYCRGGVTHIRIEQGPIDTTRDIDPTIAGVQPVKLRAFATFNPDNGEVAIEGDARGTWEVHYSPAGSGHTPFAQGFSGDFEKRGAGDTIVTTTGTLAPTRGLESPNFVVAPSEARWLDTERSRDTWSWRAPIGSPYPGGSWWTQAWQLEGNFAYLDKTPIVKGTWEDKVTGASYPEIAALQIDAPLAIKFSGTPVSELSKVDCYLDDPNDPANPFRIRSDQFVVDHENGVILFDPKAAGNIIAYKTLPSGDEVQCCCGPVYDREIAVEVDGVEVLRSKTSLARWVYEPYIIQTHRFPIDTAVPVQLQLYTPTGMVDISAAIAHVTGQLGKIVLNNTADAYAGRKVLVTFTDLVGNVQQEIHYIPYPIGKPAGSLCATSFLLHTGTDAIPGNDVNGDGVQDDGRLLSLQWDPSEDSVRPFVWPPARFGNLFHYLLGAGPEFAQFWGGTAPGENQLFTTVTMQDTSGNFDHGFLVSLYSADTLICDNNRLVNLAADGKCTWEALGTTETAPPGYLDQTLQRSFDRPNAMCLLHNGNLLVADTGNNRVVEIDESGQLKWPIDNNGEYTPLGLNTPTDVDREEIPVDFDGDGYVDDYFCITLIADEGNHRLVMTLHYENDPANTTIYVISKPYLNLPGLDMPIAPRFSTACIEKPSLPQFANGTWGEVTALQLQVLAGLENDGRLVEIPVNFTLMASPVQFVKDNQDAQVLPWLQTSRFGHITQVRWLRTGDLLVTGSAYERDIYNWTNNGTPTPIQYVNDDSDWIDLMDGVWVLRDVGGANPQLVWSYTATDYYNDPDINNFGPPVPPNPPHPPLKSFKPIWAQLLDDNTFLIVNHCYSPNGWTARSSEILEVSGPGAPGKVILNVMPDPNLLAEDAKTYPIEQPTCAIRR